MSSLSTAEQTLLTDLPLHVLQLVAANLKWDEWSKGIKECFSLSFKSSNKVCMESVTKITAREEQGSYGERTYYRYLTDLPVRLLAKCPYVQELDLSRLRFSINLKGIPSTITSLDLRYAGHVHDSGSSPRLDLSPLVGCPGLTILNLSRGYARVRDISALGRCLKLQILNLSWCDIG